MMGVSTLRVPTGDNLPCRCLVLLTKVLVSDTKCPTSPHGVTPTTIFEFTGVPVREGPSFHSTTPTPSTPSPGCSDLED